MGIKLALLLLPLVLLLVPFSYSREVTMNIAFTIAGKSGDVIHFNGTDYAATGTYGLLERRGDRFVSSEESGSMFAMAFAGDDFRSVGFNTTTANYVLSMSQGDPGIFLIGFTNGTWNNVRDKMDQIGSWHVASSTLGGISLPMPDSHNMYIILRSPYDITNYARFGGSVKLAVRNHGTARHANITIERMNP